MNNTRLIILCLLLGTFASSAQVLKRNAYLPQISSARDIQTGDVNGDGLIDLVVTTEHISGIIIYLNAGSNGFQPASQQLNTGVAKDALLADFDNDGDLDIWAGLTSTETEDLDALYINDGQGNFTKNDLDVAHNDFLTGADELLAGDLDNNGSIDVIRVQRSSGREPVGIYLHRNDGQGQFEMIELDIGFNVTRLADYNGDGLLDLWSLGSGLTVYLNNGNGEFNLNSYVTPEVSFGSANTFPYNAMVEDIDQDGDMDIQIFNSQFHLPRYLNNGDGTFRAVPVAVYTANPGKQVGLFFDADGDQDLDIWFASNVDFNSRIAYTNGAGEVDLSGTEVELSENRVDALAQADFDNDGDVDVVSLGATGMHLWQQNAPGDFENISQASLNRKWGEFHSPQVLDMNNDGHQDVLLAGIGGVKVALGNGRNGFADFTQIANDLIYRYTAADLNGDGYGDLILIKRFGQVDVLLNDQENGFDRQPLTIDAPSAYRVEAGDYDQDGDLDFIVQEYLGSIYVMQNNGTQGFEHVQTIEGGFRSADLVDLDNSGQAVIIAQNYFDFFGETTLGVIEYQYDGSKLSKNREVTIEGLHYENLVFFDHDGDGDLDILTNKEVNDDFVLVLNENSQLNLSSLEFPHGLPTLLADINQDGLVDVINDSGALFLKTNDGYESDSNEYDNPATNNREFTISDVDSDSDLDVVIYDELNGLSTLLNQTVNLDFTGLWFNPAQNGHGIQVEQIFGNGVPKVVVSWYVYHEGQQMWLIGSGDVDGQSATVDMYITSGPEFGSAYDVNDYQGQLWGTVTMELFERNTMNFQWNAINAEFGQGNIDFSRFAEIKPADISAYGINSCHSGSWFNPSQNGHGLMAQVLKTGELSSLIMTWYTYHNGQQYWLTGLGPINGNKATLSIQVTSGADFLPDFDADDVELLQWGEIDFILQDDNNARIVWRPDFADFSNGALDVTRLTQVDRYMCH